MSRRRKQDGDHADRASKFKARQRENTISAGLPDTPANRQRIEDCTWIDLASDNVRAAILRGEAVEPSALERLVAARNAILPSLKEDIRVAFVYQCIDCKAESAIDPDTLCAKCRAELPPLVPPSASPDDASATTPEAMQATVANVVSIHSHPNAPLAHHYEPWRSSIGSEFRRFDVPENF